MNYRQGEILRYIERNGAATISELTGIASDCSNMTLWRDLKQLEENGLIIRTRGGAKAISKPAHESGSVGAYSERANKNIDLKRIIGQTASKYVESGKSLFFDSGSTIMALVEAMTKQRYSIITYGANIAIALSQRSDDGIYAIGGLINGNTLSCTGKIAEAMLDDVYIDTAFMTSSGFSLGAGFTTSNMAEQAIKKKAIAKAPRVIMLLDSSKFGKIFPFSFAHLIDVDVLVTDKPLPDEYLPLLAQSDTKVVVAEEV